MKPKKKLCEKRLGQLLLENGVLGEHELKKALKIQKRSKKRSFLGEILLDLKMVAEERILEAFLNQYSYAYIPVDSYHIGRDAIRALPAYLAHKHVVVPLERVMNTLTVAMVNPLRKDAIREMEAYTHCRIVPCIAKPSELHRSIQVHYGSEM